MAKIYKIFDHFSIITFSILIIILSLWITIIPLTKSEKYFAYEFDKYNISDNIGWEYTVNENGVSKTYYKSFSEEELNLIMKTVIDYLTADLASPQVIIDEQEVFSNQAIYHLEDVLDLYKKGNTICYILLGVFILLLIYIIFRFKYIKVILKRMY